MIRGTILGLWSIGGQWGSVDDDESVRLITGAADLGVEWIDTSPIYGRTDDVLARALREGASPKIATKVGPQGEPPVCDLSPEHVRRDLERSLSRLGVERVDLVQAHWPCERGTPLDETAGALDALVQEGLAGAWGVCNFDAASVARLGCATHQAPYSLMRREIESNGVLGAQPDVALLAYETLGRGLLGARWQTLPRFDHDDHRKRDVRFWGARFFGLARSADLLRQLGERHGVSAAALARHWVATRPGVSATIVGARRLDQLEDSTASIPPAANPMLERIGHAFEMARV